MAGFKFKLQGFLNVREKLEEQKKLEYGKAVKVVEDEKAVKKALEDQRDETLGVFKNGLAEKISPVDIRNYNNFIKLTNDRIKNQELVIENAKKVVEEKRLSLVEAVKERKMLDVLKEKAMVQYLEDEKRDEQKKIDEIVSYKYSK